MSNINVAIVNASTILQDNDLKALVPALQKQVSEDFASNWGIDAKLLLVPGSFSSGVVPPSAVPKGSWVLAMLDNADQANALGYHDITPDGLPLGKVFVKTAMADNQKWSVTASHELLEMLGDPDINLTAFVEDTHGGVLYAYETCDAVEAIEYDIDGISVSDFVYPAWFESFRKDGPFDFKEQLGRPFELAAGGYIGIYRVTDGAGWQQLTARSEDRHPRNRPRVGSRRERRRTPRSHWVKSTYHSRA